MLIKPQKGTDVLKTDQDQTEAINELSKDYIIEQNLSLKKGFRKWSSGLLECWGEVERPVANSISENYAHEFSVVLPTLIVSPRYVGGQANSVTYQYVASSSYTQASAFIRDSKTGVAPTSGDACFSYHAIGRWK